MIPPRGRREQRKTETRQTISDVATELIIRRGFEAVSMSEIANAAGVSRKTVGRAIARLGIRWKRPRHQLARRPDTWRRSKGGSKAG